MLVLERGKAYPPGSFPRSPIGFKRNLWDPSEGLQGLFDLWSFSGLDALVSSGLGGGSLIYANVLLRKDEKWFVPPERPGPGGESWPLTRADLEPHYDRAERMIGVAALSRSTTRRTTARRRRSRSRPPPRSAAWTGSCRRSPSPSPTRARIPSRASRSRRSGRTSTAARGRPAGSSASATSAATTAPRTRSTTPT